MKKIFIIGGGPSVKQTNLNLIKDEFVIGTNAAFYLGDWVDICFFIDCRFYFTWNKEALDKWPNKIITTCKTLKDHPKIECRTIDPNFVISPDKDKIGQPDKGKNAGASAIDLAVKLGAKKIILIGYDMHAKNGHNYHKHHRIIPRADIYNRFMIQFKRIPNEKPKDVEILNATPNSKLDVFPKVKLSDC